MHDKVDYQITVIIAALLYWLVEKFVKKFAPNVTKNIIAFQAYLFTVATVVTGAVCKTGICAYLTTAHEGANKPIAAILISALLSTIAAQVIHDVQPDTNLETLPTGEPRQG